FGVMLGLAGPAPGLVGAVVALGAVASVLGAVAEGVAVVLVVVCAWTRPAKPVAAVRAITAVRVRFIRTLHDWGRISHPPNNSCAMMFPVRGKGELANSCSAVSRKPDDLRSSPPPTVTPASFSNNLMIAEPSSLLSPWARAI